MSGSREVEDAGDDILEPRLKRRQQLGARQLAL